jgi:hypothetical protein
MGRWLHEIKSKSLNENLVAFAVVEGYRLFGCASFVNTGPNE